MKIMLSSIRKNKKISQWQLALKTGIPQSTLSTFECGYREPTKEQKKRIATVLGFHTSVVFPTEKKENEAF